MSTSYPSAAAASLGKTIGPGRVLLGVDDTRSGRNGSRPRSQAACQPASSEELQENRARAPPPDGCIVWCENIGCAGCEGGDTPSFGRAVFSLEEPRAEAHRRGFFAYKNLACACTVLPGREQTGVSRSTSAFPFPFFPFLVRSRVGRQEDVLMNLYQMLTRLLERGAPEDLAVVALGTIVALWYLSIHSR